MSEHQHSVHICEGCQRVMFEAYANHECDHEDCQAAQARAIEAAVAQRTAELREAHEKERQDWNALCQDWTVGLDEAIAERDSWKRTAAADAAYGAEKANALDDVRARSSELRMERDAARAALATIAEAAATWEDSPDPWAEVGKIGNIARNALEGK